MSRILHCLCSYMYWCSSWPSQKQRVCCRTKRTADVLQRQHTPPVHSCQNAQSVASSVDLGVSLGGASGPQSDVLNMHCWFHGCGSHCQASGRVQHLVSCRIVMLGMWVLLEAVIPLSVETWLVGVARNHFKKAPGGPTSLYKIRRTMPSLTCMRLDTSC